MYSRDVVYICMCVDACEWRKGRTFWLSLYAASIALRPFPGNEGSVCVSVHRGNARRDNCLGRGGRRFVMCVCVCAARPRAVRCLVYMS